MTFISLIRITIVWSQESIYVEWSFFSFQQFAFRFLFLLDTIRITFWLSVLWIALSVFTFRYTYIKNESQFNRFHSILRVFVVSILVLIARPRFVRSLLGWDGLGLSSYLLVIYYANNKSYNSGIITALTNRFGDSLMLIVITILIIECNWSMQSLRGLWDSKSWLWLFILAAFTKRAQIPFSAWLPAAIAAPTPVSSLVHSSTLVTAGVYLLIRFRSGFESAHVLWYLGAAGTLTTLMARLAALIETDLKKIVALSTLRQLGVIVSLLRLGLSEIAFLHLLAHAFFKALLFLGTGGIIHSASRGQDLRRIGRRSISFRSTKRITILANLRLAGLPFISAFFSKEVFFEGMVEGLFSIVSVAMFYVSVLLTVLYSIRFIGLYYTSDNKRLPLINAADEDYLSQVSMILLSVPAITGGSILGFQSLDWVSPVRSTANYLTLLIRIILIMLGASVMWAKAHWLKLSATILSLATIWGLTSLSRLIGLIISSPTPKLLVLNDTGIHSALIRRLVFKVTNSFPLGLLNKTLASSLSLVLIWGLLIMLISYYLNNRQVKLLLVSRFRNLPG